MAFEKDPRDPEGGNYPEPGLHNVWHHLVTPRNRFLFAHRGKTQKIYIFQGRSGRSSQKPTKVSDAEIAEINIH